jgi:hypothetical protein
MIVGSCDQYLVVSTHDHEEWVGTGYALYLLGGIRQKRLRDRSPH